MRRPKSAHKNANSGRRQTNHIQNGYITILPSCTEFAFYQIHHDRRIGKKGYIYIPFKKRKYTHRHCICSLFGDFIIAQAFTFVNLYQKKSRRARARRLCYCKNYGVRRFGPRKRNSASLIERPRNSIVIRSIPIPKPPCGGQP